MRSKRLQDPAFDPLYFSKIVTRDASPEAGAAEQCVPNVRQAWKTLFSWGRHTDGREDIRSAMHICSQADLKTSEDVLALAQWLQSAFDYIAMVRS